MKCLNRTAFSQGGVVFVSTLTFEPLKKMNSMNQTDHCPEDSVLAAFMEGRLSAERKREIQRHLNSCKQCYAALAGAIDINRELEAASEPPDDEQVKEPGTLYGKSSNRLKRTKLAAIVLPVAAAFMLFALSGGDPEWSSNTVMGDLSDPADISRIASGISSRQESAVILPFNQGISDQKIAFHSGVTVVRLEVLSKAGMRQKGQDELSSLRKMLAPGAENSAFCASLLDILRPLDIERSATSAETTVKKIEAFILETDNAFYYKLGFLVEAGKAYAIIGKADLLDPELPEEIAADSGFLTLPPGVVRRFNEFRSLLDKKSVDGKGETIYKLLHEIGRILS